MFFNNEVKDSKIEVRISEKNKNKIKELAKKEGLNLSQFLLKCVDLYVKYGFSE